MKEEIANLKSDGCRGRDGQSGRPQEKLLQLNFFATSVSTNPKYWVVYLTCPIQNFIVFEFFKNNLVQFVFGASFDSLNTNILMLSLFHIESLRHVLIYTAKSKMNRDMAVIFRKECKQCMKEEKIWVATSQKTNCPEGVHNQYPLECRLFVEISII